MAERDAFDYVNKIWAIADYVRDVIRPADYNKLILPFAVLRRFECALESTRERVYKQVQKGVWDDDDPRYCVLSGHCFFNTTSFRLNDLGASRTYDALMSYIGGFSENAREVLLKFQMENTCKTLDDKGMLYEVCTRFSGFDLGPDAVSDRLMSDIYEHLIERYGEEISQDAEDFMTPRDVARLATALLFANEESMLNATNGDVKTLYDGSCGTCGFISDALDLLEEWHRDGSTGAPTRIIPYGQELEDATWAMGKAALMLRNIADGSGDVADRMNDLAKNIMLGDTLDDDQFSHMTFDYQLTNPPYGKKWEKEQKAVKDEAALGEGGRFAAGIPPISDGSMLFLQNLATKMTPVEKGGGKAAIVLSGSPLFSNQGGQSNIRRWLFAEDLVECIVKLPTSIFFRTGITTYIWVLNNHKASNRTHRIQLIDASEQKIPLRKSLGNKRFEIGERQVDWIVRTYVDGHDHGKSVIVPDSDFMYRTITTQQPLHIKIMPRIDNLGTLFSHSKPMEKLNEESCQIIVNWVQQKQSEDAELTYGEAEDAAKVLIKSMRPPKPPKAKLLAAIVAAFGRKSADYPVATDSRGAYVYDPDLKDEENVPFCMDISDYMEREVLPFAPEAVVDESVRDEKGMLADRDVGVVGTSISFNRYFYKYATPREPSVIAEEILALEDGLGASMKEFLS